MALDVVTYTETMIYVKGGMQMTKCLCNQTRRRTWRNRCLICLLFLGITCGFLECGRNVYSAQHLISGNMIRVYDLDTDTVMSLDVEVYLTGVVAAEMPATFELEALKAQAVAARTFALKRMNTPNSNVTALYPEAQITTSPATCQAWISDDEQRERWGKDYTTPWTAACQSSQSLTISQSLPKFMSIELVMPSNHPILCDISTLWYSI